MRWVETHQNADGGCGESCRSYEDDAWRGRGDSTPSQTAWALLALLAAGGPELPAVQRGVAYLVDTQREAGGWHEEPSIECASGASGSAVGGGS